VVVVIVTKPDFQKISKFKIRKKPHDNTQVHIKIHVTRSLIGRLSRTGELTEDGFVGLANEEIASRVVVVVLSWLSWLSPSPISKKKNPKSKSRKKKTSRQYSSLGCRDCQKDMNSKKKGQSSFFVYDN
jgi:hypothetical protein